MFLSNALGGGAGLGGGDATTAQAQDGGASAVLHGDLVGADGLDGVTGADAQQVGSGTEQREDFDGLMGGAVFAELDGVVSGDVDDAELGEGGETDGAPAVGHEVQEGGDLKRNFWNFE